MNILANLTSPLTGIAHWALRITFAATFLFHGIDKVFNFGGFVGMMQGATVMAALVTFAEVAAGVGILLGGILPLLGRVSLGDLATRLSGLAALPVGLGAIFIVHLANGFNIMAGGFEFALMFTMIAAYFLIKGNEA